MEKKDAVDLIREQINGMESPNNDGRPEMSHLWQKMSIALDQQPTKKVKLLRYWPLAAGLAFVVFLGARYYNITEHLVSHAPAQALPPVVVANAPSIVGRRTAQRKNGGGRKPQLVTRANHHRAKYENNRDACLYAGLPVERNDLSHEEQSAGLDATPEAMAGNSATASGDAGYPY